LEDHFWRDGVPMAEDAVMVKQLANQRDVFASSQRQRSADQTQARRME